MEEIIKSVGIDIGTSTTQLVFSKLTIVNQAGSYAVPRISIIDKQVIYRSDIHFTPLRSNIEIDADAVKKIVQEEYKKAGITPADLKTGAVIITGETARKQNANEVLASLSDLAGDFVVATAGPDLESVLSARGAGADRLSREHRTVITNLDIGGGTSNLATYEKETLKGTSCLDIGGRLIKIQNGKITYIFHKTQTLAKNHGISIAVGDTADVATLSKICDLMADHLARALHILPIDEEHLTLYTNDGKPLPETPKIAGITFSGGVADYVYHEAGADLFQYGDIGILLGQAIRRNKALQQVHLYQADETIRATVVGAGEHTTEVSGSTISYAQGKLPLKNVPILKIPKEEEASLEMLTASIINQLPIYMPEGKPEQVAIAFTGHGRNGFQAVQDLAKSVIQGAKIIIESEFPLVLIVEDDIGKVLGNALNVQLGHRKDVICIDGIRTLSGDYIDIGEPLANGHVVPVVIKTLIFNS